VADGISYHDTRAPFIAADIGSVTLASTAKALYPANSFPPLGAGYFQSFVGKKIRIKMFGRMTTAATPGNGSFDIYFGTGADANGTILASSAALALVANGTNLSWSLELNITVRKLNDASNGALLVTGKADFNVGLLLSTNAPMLIPASVPAQVSVDLTTSNIISVQFKRSGSTVETMQVHDMTVEVLN
jgi:hypothetical protein